MPNYAAIQANASKSIGRAGQTITIRREGDGVYDPNTGMVVPSSKTQSAVATVFPFNDADVDGTLIQASDKRVLVGAGLVFTPATSDIVTIQGEDYTVIRVKELAPAGVPVLYTLQVRR